MIHAEIYRKLLSISTTTQGNIDWNYVTELLNTNNYPGLFDYYTRYTTSDNSIDHQMMGAHYINIMVNFLKQVYGNKYTDIEYKAIAWLGGGLNETRAWDKLSDDQQKKYIKDYIDYESTGSKTCN